MIFDFVCKQIALQMAVEESAIADNTPFEEIGVDPVELILIAMAVEEHFEILLEDEQLERLLTVGDLVRLIEDEL